MAKHKTDQFGMPTDPKLYKLEKELEILSGIFRGLRGKPEEQLEIVEEYLAVFQKLYDLGWDGGLDMMSELPSEFMPQRYLNQYPHRNVFRQDS
jgi:hypothetical protein